MHIVGASISMMDGIGQSRPLDAPSTDHAPVQGFPYLRSGVTKFRFPPEMAVKKNDRFDIDMQIN